MLIRNRLRLVTSHLARRNAAGLLDPLHPTDCRADREAQLLGCLIAGHPALDRGHNTLAKIQRACPSMLASLPANMVNQKRTDLGIPNRFTRKRSAAALLIDA